MPQGKRDALDQVERFQGRLLRENEIARKAWDDKEPTAGERGRATKLTPEEAKRKAIEVARRNHED